MPGAIVGAVTVSFVLRLVEERLLAGEIVGEVQSVSDGENTLVRNLADLRSFLLDAAPRARGDRDEQQG